MLCLTKIGGMDYNKQKPFIGEYLNSKHKKFNILL